MKELAKHLREHDRIKTMKNSKRAYKLIENLWNLYFCKDLVKTSIKYDYIFLDKLRQYLLSLLQPRVVVGLFSS